MKKLFSILLVAVLIVTSFTTVAFAAGSATASVSKDQTVHAGDTVTLTVTVSGEFSNYELTMTAAEGLTITAITGVTSNINNGKVAFSSAENNASHSFTVTVKVADDIKPGSYVVKADLTKASMIVPVEQDTEDGIPDGLIRVTLNDGSATLTVVCDHVWGDWTQTKAPSCTEEGVEERVCSKCGETETRKVDKVAHAWSDWTQTKAPTCTEEGIETRTCSVCGETETRKVDKVAHAWGEWTQTKAPTCNAEGEETRTCSVCGETETRKVDKLTHAWGEWKQTKAPTCTEEGVEERVCSACGEKETRKVDKVAHSWSDWKVEKEATCTEDGLKSRTCSVCGEKQTEVIPSAEGHQWGEWTVTKEATCTENGERTRTCSACGEVQTEVIEANGHVWSEEWSHDENNHWHECTVCGEKCEHNAEHGPITEWQIVKEPTANETGLQEKYCEVCGAVVGSEEIPANGQGVIDPVPGTGDPTGMLMIGGLSFLLLLLLAAALYVYNKRKGAAK